MMRPDERGSAGALLRAPRLRKPAGPPGLFLILLPLLLMQWPPPWLKPRPAGPVVYPRLLVTPAELAAGMADSGWVAVDARPRAAYGSEHVPGARHVDARAVPPPPTGLAALFAKAGLSSTGTVVCYSDGTDPAAAGELLWLLDLAGHPDARVLNGGLAAWKKAGRPTHCTAPPETPPGRFTARPDTARIADYAYVRATFGRHGHTIMDGRSGVEWFAGHIPHSLPFPVEELLNEDGTVMDGPTMRPYFEAFGPRENEPVDLSDEFIVQCGDETRGRPVHPYLAARLGGVARVRGYPEGFKGWASHGDAPVVRIVKALEVRSLLEAGGRHLKDAPDPAVILIDLRAEGDYRSGHLPGAVCLSPGEFWDKFPPLMKRLWPKADPRTTPVVFYCYGPGCTRSRNCSTMAAQMGYQNLLWFRDGALGWGQLGEELDKGDVETGAAPAGGP